MPKKPRGHEVEYSDLVRLTDGRYALVNPLVPLESMEAIREILSAEEAWERVRAWPQDLMRRPDGSLYHVTLEGQAWLGEGGSN